MAAVLPDESESDMDPMHGAASSATVQTPPSSSQHEPVLIIDDESIIRSLLQEYLSLEGYPVLTAASGPEGLELFRRMRPPIVVTDVCMPNMDGLAVLRAVHREDPDAKVVVMTGYGDDTVAFEALRAGASNYIKKPLSLEAFLFIVRAHERMIRAQQRQRLPDGALVEERKIIRLANDMSVIYATASNITQSLQNFADRQEIESISLALSEAIINAVEHGNLGIGYGLKSAALRENRYTQLLQERLNDLRLAARRVTVESLLTPRSAWFQVTDEGNGFDWRSLPDPADPENLMKEHGRGLSIIGLFMSEVGYNESGNQVWMRKDLDSNG